MVTFEVSAVVDAPASRAWSLLTDWKAHGRWIPLTTVRTTPAPDGGSGLGSGFVAITRLGPFRLVDPMTVTEWVPPSDRGAGHGTTGRCQVTKLGPALLGGAVIEVQPLADGRTRIDWFEDAHPGPRLLARLARPFDPLTRPLSRRIFEAALRKAVREIESVTPKSDPDE
jgi:hypothetical protein